MVEYQSNIHDESVAQFVDNILQTAIERRASDIHFEPFADHFRIRLRIDGVLQSLPVQPGVPMPQLIARLKIMAQLDIAERRMPQDGVLKLALKNTQYALRISTLPTQYGEKAVLRLQENNPQHLKLHQLGLSEIQYANYLQALQNPHGFILVTGPTGSGKTLTLYSGIQQLNNQQRSICSVEDPIEMPLVGINQTAINTKINLSFSRVLRALLRQDPDVIMIGEIRDSETAEIAVKAAQTGHLVLSTLHTNSAGEALVRLEQMGIPSYLLTSSLKLIISQRLVRLLCTKCKLPIEDKEHIKTVPLRTTLNAWQAVGCEACFSGYLGRIGIYETLRITPEIQQLLLAGTSAEQLATLAHQQGSLSLLESGLNLVEAGLTTLNEIYRVLGES